MTTRIFDIIQSELIKRGYNEFVDNQGNLVFFDDDFQFMNKIFSYDDDIAEIVDELFTGLSLRDNDNDNHFKKNFLYRFINRKINRQTVEAFRLELLATFLSNEDFINRVYDDLDKYVEQTHTTESKNKQENSQVTDGETITDNRTAFADLPQNNVQLDVNNTIMESATDNTISRNKQGNLQNVEGETINDTTGENKSYSLDELFKTNGLLEQVFNIFDKKCFMQIW